MFKTTFVASVAILASLALSAPMVYERKVADQTPHMGDVTFYSTGLGACGKTSTDEDFIVALSFKLFDSFGTGGDPNQNPLCLNDQMINIQPPNGGPPVALQVVDKCVGCAEYDLDLSPAAFKVLADPSVGRIPNVSWMFV